MRMPAFLPSPELKRIAYVTTIALAALAGTEAWADTITDWNLKTTLATKGATSATTGVASIALNSNVSTRIAAIEARAVFDAVNVINQFSPTGYYYSAATPPGTTPNSAAAAAAQAAHDVLFGTLPNNANWTATRTWLDNQLTAEFSLLGVNPLTDPGVAVGQAAAAAALAARAADYSAIRTNYIPTSNISGTGTPNATGNPGAGLWRPSNGVAGDIDPVTGAPTGFVAGVIQPAAAIDFNWKNVTPFSLTTLKKQQLVAAVPPALKLSGTEYANEKSYVQTHGQESSTPGSRTADQTAQALYYKLDAELFVNEAARIGAVSRGYTLNQNAKLFAALDGTLADARIAAWQSKYDLAFWRPITALNADSAGNVTTYTWKPLGATPAHPSNTGGHSTTVAAGVEILRSFFASDDIQQGGATVTLTSPSWLVGTNNGTGDANPLLNGQSGTTRDVSTLTRLQLENGQSRIYLGVHFGIDNYQGQSLGLAVADAIINAHTDPSVAGISVFSGGPSVATAPRLYNILVSDSANSGYFGGL